MKGAKVFKFNKKFLVITAITVITAIVSGAALGASRANAEGGKGGEVQSVCTLSVPLAPTKWWAQVDRTAMYGEGYAYTSQPEAENWFSVNRKYIGSRTNYVGGNPVTTERFRLGVTRDNRATFKTVRLCVETYYEYPIYDENGYYIGFERVLLESRWVRSRSFVETSNWMMGTHTRVVLIEIIGARKGTMNLK